MSIRFVSLDNRRRAAADDERLSRLIRRLDSISAELEAKSADVNGKAAEQAERLGLSVQGGEDGLSCLCGRRRWIGSQSSDLVSEPTHGSSDVIQKWVGRLFRRHNSSPSVGGTSEGMARQASTDPAAPLSGGGQR